MQSGASVSLRRHRPPLHRRTAIESGRLSPSTSAQGQKSKATGSVAQFHPAAGQDTSLTTISPAAVTPRVRRVSSVASVQDSAKVPARGRGAGSRYWARVSRTAASSIPAWSKPVRALFQIRKSSMSPWKQRLSPSLYPSPTRDGHGRRTRRRRVLHLSDDDPVQVEPQGRPRFDQGHVLPTVCR